MWGSEKKKKKKRILLDYRSIAQEDVYDARGSYRLAWMPFVSRRFKRSRGCVLRRGLLNDHTLERLIAATIA